MVAEDLNTLDRTKKVLVIYNPDKTSGTSLETIKLGDPEKTFNGKDVILLPLTARNKRGFNDELIETLFQNPAVVNVYVVHDDNTVTLWLKFVEYDFLEMLHQVYGVNISDSKGSMLMWSHNVLDETETPTVQDLLDHEDIDGFLDTYLLNVNPDFDREVTDTDEDEDDD